MNLMRVTRCLVFAALPAGLAGQTPQGWSVAHTMVTDSGPGHGRFTSVQQTDVLNGKMRIGMEMTGTARSALVGGFYQIFDTVAHTVHQVMPAAHIVILMDAAAVARTGADMPRVPKTELVGAPSVVVTDLGPGETLLGYPTHRYRTARDYRMRVTIGEMTCTRHVSNVSESWVAEGVDVDFSAIQAEIMRLSGLGAPRADTGTASKIVALMQDNVKGMPLRTISTERKALASGDSITVRTTTEYTTLKRGADPSVFEVPKDIEVTDMRGMPPVTDASLSGRMEQALAKRDSTLRKSMCDASSP
jgi:hypothetical protein